MTLPTVLTALARATVEVAGVNELPARFILYPRFDQDPSELARRIAAELQVYMAQPLVNTDTERAVIIVTLPARIMIKGAEAYEAAYAIANYWQLKSAEPELYTDFFPETEVVRGDGTDESIHDACWAPADPRVDANPRWALDMLRVPQAWEWSLMQGRPAYGDGVIIAQPDTGVTDHPELRDVPRVGAIDLISGGDTATDPLDYYGNTSHGTGTGSVLLSRSAENMTGSAPGATHMPIRAIRSVIRISQLSVADAINHAVDKGAHVITMSLGGLPSMFLWLALQRAVKNNVIVLAAAGNCVETVVWPARYDDCIGVAGVNFDEQRWRGSCRGGTVAVAAPAENVIKALTLLNGGTKSYHTEQGQGTSFAVALTAGVAALWLAHHGRDVVVSAAAAQHIPVQALFKNLLRATARKPNTDWDESAMGSGIVDAEALLKAPLTLVTGEEANETGAEASESIRNLLDEAQADSALEQDALDLYGMELADVALEARLCCADGAESNEDGPLQVSEQLRQTVPLTTLERLAAVQP
ncbi:Subtilase family protein [Janthinobacterium psychrotolerans]|uniref:Subtilase family protein n=2 Tax=Janthinobacterium psychrotolerans TaxID=1747903 RepID=A0A1A7C8Q0_9BURK|nr:Subtilase family protein [Janthinobacterium psychrotolerans]